MQNPICAEPIQINEIWTPNWPKTNGSVSEMKEQEGIVGFWKGLGWPFKGMKVSALGGCGAPEKLGT